MRLSHLLSVFEGFYDPAWAESWDTVGLTCGDPDQEVRRVMFAVDPVAAVVEEALGWGADLLITHHPLLLRPVHSVAAITPKGRLIHRMIRSGLALYTAHTNADVADPGVSDALARAVGVSGPLRPMVPSEADHRRGLGRIGSLSEPIALRDFAARVSAGLPATAGAVRVAGPLDAIVGTVAVCGGAGDSLLGTAREAGVDVYVTADLRHHPASEFREHAAAGDGAPALIDAGHWATEWPWLVDAERRLRDATTTSSVTTASAATTTTTSSGTASSGTASTTAVSADGPGAVDSAGAGGPHILETRVSTLVTDAWTLSRTVKGAL